MLIHPLQRIPHWKSRDFRQNPDRYIHTRNYLALEVSICIFPFSWILSWISYTKTRFPNQNNLTVSIHIQISHHSTILLVHIGILCGSSNLKQRPKHIHLGSETISEQFIRLTLTPAIFLCILPWRLPTCFGHDLEEYACWKDTISDLCSYVVYSRFLLLFPNEMEREASG